MTAALKISKLMQPSPAPMNRAMVFICEKCGKRAGSSGKNASHRLASKFKRLTKHEFDKGDVRIVLTSCMDICPDDQIAISLQPSAAEHPAAFWVSDIDDLDASSEALLETLRRMLNES
jgi:predicted metal-binding protein